MRPSDCDYQRNLPQPPYPAWQLELFRLIELIINSVRVHTVRPQ